MAEVEVYEVFGFVGHEGAEISSHDAVPCRALAFIELGGMSGRSPERGNGERTVFLMCIAIS